MTKYNVHLFREMRVTIRDVEAESLEKAAELCRDNGTSGNHVKIEECDGQTFGALVDVVGDADYSQSKMIDWRGSPLRDAAPELLESLEHLLEQTVEQDMRYGIPLSEGEEDARAKALKVIQKARAA